MTDYIEILHEAGKIRAMMVLHDQGCDVNAYLSCSSGDIGAKLERRIRSRFGAMLSVAKYLRLQGENAAADDLDLFIEASHRMCGDGESDRDIEDFLNAARDFVVEHSITIKDH